MPQSEDVTPIPRAFKVEVETLANGLQAFNIVGELDQANADELRAPLVEAIEAGANGVLLDLSDCEFIDSTGLSVLVQARRMLVENGGEKRGFGVCCPDPQVRRILEITGLDREMGLHDSRDDALAAIGG
jgi:anti-sigma B factor antagonist